MTYAPAVSARPAAPEQDDNKAPGDDIDQLLSQLTKLINRSVAAQDSSAPDALMALLATGEQPTAVELPPELLELLNNVLGVAQAGGAEAEFKALLSEYISVRWALSELEQMMAKMESGELSPDDTDYFNQLAAAQAFLRQLEAAIAGRLDTQNWYTQWRELYRDGFEGQLPSADADLATQLQGSDAAQVVISLLNASPRADLSAVTPQAV
jgi:hypothetical protein